MNSFSKISLLSLIFICSCEKTIESDLLVINVLDKDLYDDCHIKGSINVPFDDLESFATSLDREKTIVIYCSNYMCGASSEGYKILTKMGFKNVYAYEGGIAEWFILGMPFVGPAKLSYLKFNVPIRKHINDSIRKISANDLKILMIENKLLDKDE